MKYSRFEDLPCWQKARELCQAVFKVIKFLGYALRSCSEVQSQLYRALDCQYISKEQFEHLYGLAGDCRGQIKAFRGYLRKNN